MTQLTRSAGLTGFVSLIRSYRLDPLALAREANVPEQALFEPDLKISAASGNRLLELAATRTGAEDFGLRLAECRRLSNLGPIALLAAMQPSLRGMLDILCRYQHLNIEPLSLTLEEFDTVAVLRVELALEDLPVSRQAVELTVGALCRYLRSALPPQWRPKVVMFRHNPPANLTMHRHIFRCVPDFRADFDGLVLDVRDLDSRFHEWDPVLVGYLQTYIDQLARSGARNQRDDISEVIALLLPTGSCRASAVASHLGIDRRTLHRRLAAKGLSFRDLVEKKRMHLVLAYLSAGRSLGDVAELVGLASQNSLSHWFRRHFHCSLHDYLKGGHELRAADPADGAGALDQAGS